MLLAALFASIASSYVAKIKGRKLCMVLAGVFYLIGAGLTAGAVARSSGLIMLVIGRCCLGVGVGFGNSVSFPYLVALSVPVHLYRCVEPNYVSFLSV